MRRGAWLALLSVALAAAAWALLRFGFVTPLFNLALSRGLADRTNLQVRVGALRWDIFHFLEADDVVVLAPVQGAKIPLLTLDRLSIDYDLRPALRERQGWRKALRLVRLHQLKLFVLRGPSGVWNLASLQGLKGSGAAPSTDGGRLPLLPPFRVVLDDSEVVLNDELRGFHSTIDRIEGHLDTRTAPLVRFALAGHTDGHHDKNLAMTGALNQKDGSLNGRLNLESVALARYLNYFLPIQGLRFTGGTASLNLRLRRKSGQEIRASGRAELSGGALILPGIKEPLNQVSGGLTFDPGSLRFQRVQAHFLGSDWGVSGAILDLGRPRYDLVVSNPALPLMALSQQVRGLDILDLSGTASVTASMVGPALSPEVKAFLSVPELGIVGLQVESVSAGTILSGPHLSVSRLEGTLWGGQLDGNASMDLSEGGGLAADLTVTGGLLQLARLRGSRLLPFDGMVQAHAVASGRLRSPNVAVDLSVDKLRLGLWKLGNLAARAAYTSRGLQGGFSSSSGRLAGTVAFSRGSGKTAAAFHDTRVSLRQVDLSETAEGLASARDALGWPAAASDFVAGLKGRVGGLLDAVFTVEGPLRSPTLWMEAKLPAGRLAPWNSVPATRFQKSSPAGMDLRLYGFLGFHSGTLILGRDSKPLHAALGPHKQGLELQALGTYPLLGTGAPGHMALTMDLDLRLLDTLDFFEKSQGRLSADLVVGGTAASPRAQGTLTLDDFSCEPSAYLAPIKDGSMKLLFSGQTLELSALSFKAPGVVSALGGLNLSGGLDDLRGSVEIKTDGTGLRIENWDSMGSGNLVLAPLRLGLAGRDQPLSVGGTVRLSDARIVYQGKSGSSGAGAAPPSAPARPMALDLHVGLGSNVWYEKVQSKTVDFRNPEKWLSDTLNSAEESLLQPDISFRVAPTVHDFIVRGTTPDLDLRGELEIDRGRITIRENDFDITDDRGPALIRFGGQRADISGTAEARLNYTRDDPVTGRPHLRTVEVYAMLSPRTDEEREAAGLSGTFLNYQLSFDSDPQIIPDNPDLQQTAVIDLVLLGDPLVDVGDQGSTALGSGGGAADQGALLAGAGLGTVTTGFARKELAQLLGNFKFFGGHWLDVVRVNPRIVYQTVGAVPIQAQGAPVGQAVAGGSSSQYDIDWALELGKSIGEKLYASLQMLTFGENARDSVIVADQSNETVQSYGARLGLEYQVSRYRSIDVYGDFGCDDDLNPVAYAANQEAPYPSYLVQMRNTIPTGNYGTILARSRRWESIEGVAP